MRKRGYVPGIALMCALALTACKEPNVSNPEPTDAVPESEIDTNQLAEGDTQTGAVTEEGTQEPEPEKEPMASEKEESAKKETFVDVEKTMYLTQLGIVRKKAAHNAAVVSRVPKAAAITVTGYCEATDWYRVHYANRTGYIPGVLLSDEKPIVSVPTEEHGWVYKEESEPDEKGIVYITGIYRVNGLEVRCENTHSMIAERQIAMAEAGVYGLYHESKDGGTWDGCYYMLIENWNDLHDYYEYMGDYISLEGNIPSSGGGHKSYVYRMPVQEGDEPLTITDRMYIIED